MDLSYEAIKAGAKEVVVCHRGGYGLAPRPALEEVTDQERPQFLKLPQGAERLSDLWRQGALCSLLARA